MPRNSRKRIKVLLEVHPLVIGGLGRFLESLLAHLDRDRFEPALVSYRDGASLRIFQGLDVRVEVIDYRKDPARLVRYLKEAQVDVAQTNCLSFGLALAARAANIPHIWCLNGHLDLVRVKFLEGEKKRIALQSIPRLSEMVICPSRFLRSQFRGIGGRGNIRVVYNGVDLGQIDREVRRSSAGSHNGRPRIGMIARIQPQKRQLDFVRAARKILDKFPQAAFHVFGGTNPEEGSREYARLLAREVRRLGLRDSLTFRECLEGRFEEFEPMTVFVLPSIQEGASIGLLEAMALGKPVIAARSGGNGEFVRENRTGFLVPPARPQAIADAVMRILADSRLARRLGRQGRRYVEQNFDIRGTVRDYERLWFEVSRRRFLAR